jgi:hypothetical protein
MNVPEKPIVCEQSFLFARQKYHFCQTNVQAIGMKFPRFLRHFFIASIYVIGMMTKSQQSVFFMGFLGFSESFF